MPKYLGSVYFSSVIVIVFRMRSDHLQTTLIMGAAIFNIVAHWCLLKNVSFHRSTMPIPVSLGKPSRNGEQGYDNQINCQLALLEILYEYKLPLYNDALEH